MNKLQHVDKQALANHPALVALLTEVQSKQKALADLKSRRKTLKSELKSDKKALKKEWKVVEKMLKAEATAAKKMPVKKTKSNDFKSKTAKQVALNPAKPVAIRAAKTANVKAVKTAPAKAAPTRKRVKKAA